MTPEAKARRKKYAQKLKKNANWVRKRTVAAKKYYQKNKAALKRKGSATRKKRSTNTLHYVKVKPLTRT